MAAGMMNTLLGGTDANTCAASEQVTAVTLTTGSKTGASCIYLSAIGGAVYVNFGAAASATACRKQLLEGASELLPIAADPYVVEKDSGAKWAASYWR